MPKPSQWQVTAADCDVYVGVGLFKAMRSPAPAPCRRNSLSLNQPRDSMKYATVITTTQEMENHIPHTYFISAADADGQPQGGEVGKFARIRFESPEVDGCHEVDVMGILMHRMAAVAQDGNHRHYERAIQCLKEAMDHTIDGQVIELLPTADMRELATKTLPTDDE